MTKVFGLFIGLVALGATAVAQPIIDNERVTVWNNGSPGAGKPGAYDAVFVNLAGKATFLPKGKPLPTAQTGKSVLIELKDLKVEPLANPTKYPLAFPRPHSKKVLENARVRVWDYAWVPNEPTPMHFHDKDVVVMYMEDGSLTSTTPTGEVTTNDYKPGVIRFNKGNRTHTEVLSRGKQHAMMVELK